MLAFAAMALVAGPLRPCRADEPVSGIFADAIAKAQKRCAKVYGAGTNVEAGYATGLVVSANGLILTAQGIYLSANQLRVVLADGSTHDASIVRRSEPLQAVLLKVDASTPDFFELPKEPNVSKGDWVLAVTNLFKVAEGTEPLSVNLGVVSLRTRVSARHRTQDVPYEGDVLLVDAITSNPGASGGALVDAEGRLVGMVGKLLESKGTNTRINYAVPADLLHGFALGKESPATQETPQPAATAGQGKATTGIRVFTLAGKRSPAYIDSVQPGSAAERAGLKKDDLVLSVAGEAVRDIRDFEKAAARLQPGREVTLVVKRKNDVLPLRITPDEERTK
ncbi:MAG: S1C family serine protease [Pirellulales bacterium]